MEENFRSDRGRTGKTYPGSSYSDSVCRLRDFSSMIFNCKRRDWKAGIVIMDNVINFGGPRDAKEVNAKANTKSKVLTRILFSYETFLL